MPLSSIKSIKVHSVAAQVTERLKEAIYSGELEPGEQLNEAELAEAFGVSRSPIREALWELTRLGLVEPMPRRGVRVVRLTPALVREVMDVRAVLEGLAARQAAGRIPKSELDRYLNIFETMAQTMSPMDEGYPQEVGDFHELIIEHAGNQKLQNMLETIWALVKLIRYRSGSVPERAARVFQEHLAIARALAAGDGEEAERLMRQHITAAIESFLANLKHPQGKQQPQGRRQPEPDR